MLVPITKGNHQELQHDLVMNCGGAGSRRYPNNTTPGARAVFLNHTYGHNDLRKKDTVVVGYVNSSSSVCCPQ